MRKAFDIIASFHDEETSLVIKCITACILYIYIILIWRYLNFDSVLVLVLRPWVLVLVCGSWSGRIESWIQVCLTMSCVVCKLNVSKCQHALECNNCRQRWHRKCQTGKCSLLDIFTWLDWTLPQPSSLSLFVFWMMPLCATVSFSISFLFLQFPIPLHWGHWVCILLCGCVGLFVRRRCCGFLVRCYWEKNRLSNSKLHHYFVVLHFWFLSFAWDSSNSFKSYFCFSYCFDCSFLFGFYSYRFTSFMGVCVVVIRLHFQRSSGRCHATQLN